MRCIAERIRRYAGGGAGTERAGESRQEFDRLEEFYFQRKEPVRVETCPLADVTLLEHYKERGLSRQRIFQCDGAAGRGTERRGKSAAGRGDSKSGGEGDWICGR